MPWPTADRYSALKTKTWYETCETHNIAFYLLVLADTGEMAEEDEPLSCLLSVTWSMQKKSFGRFLIASLVAAILLRVLFWPILSFKLPFRSLKLVSPGSFRLLPPFWFWSLLFSLSEILAPGGAQFSLLRRVRELLYGKVWWTWDFWCLSTPDFCLLSAPSMIAWLHKTRSIFAC